MRFWDASALVPLIVREPESNATREWLRADPSIVTWAWTRVEIASAVERRVRNGELTRTERRSILDSFDVLAEAWDEVIDVIAVRSRALSLLARHPIRAADAAQLGAALLVAGAGSSRLTFVCLDQNLAKAAELEGLRPLPE